MMTLLAFELHHDTVSDDVDHKLSHDTPTLRAAVTPGDEAVGGDDSPEARVVKVCKSCMRSAPEEAEFCPQCGDELLSIRRVPDMYLDEVVGGKYRIVEKIGQGGMGVVYLARNDEVGQKVAVKFLSRKFADDKNLVLRFFNEAKSYCRVNHPNAVTFLDYGQHDDGAIYIITEFVDGKNVTETLKDRGPLPADTVLDLATQIAEVLSAAHGIGVIHRDLKPDNIMLMPLSRGRYAVKVLDFGIAKIVDEEEGPNTETGSVFGTPEFMSPEQARGDDADGRSDIYALGVILFYMVTGKLPFRGKNKLVVLNMQLNDPAPRPRDVNPDADLSARFESVIMKCLNKGRNQRYDSADDLLEAFEELRVPGGHVTSRVGAMRDAARTPMLRETSETSEGNWDEIHSHADTLASLEHSRGDWEVESIELGREQDSSRLTSTDRSPGAMSLAVLAIAVLAVAALLWLAVGEDRSDASSGPDPVGQSTLDGVDSSHRDAVIDTVRKLISDGRLDEARTMYDYSPVSDHEDRALLRKELEDLERARREIDAAIANKDCARAEGVATTVGVAVLKKKFDVTIGRCKESAKAAAEKLAAEKLAAEKLAAEKAAREAAASQSDRPPRDNPPRETIADPDPAGEDLPDDMALPPKTVDE